MCEEIDTWEDWKELLPAVKKLEKQIPKILKVAKEVQKEAKNPEERILMFREKIVKKVRKNGSSSGYT